MTEKCSLSPKVDNIELDDTTNGSTNKTEIEPRSCRSGLKQTVIDDNEGHDIPDTQSDNSLV